MIEPATLLLFLLPVAYFVFWVWMLVDAIQNEPEGQDRLLWVLLIALLAFPFAILYFFIKKLPRSRAQAGRRRRGRVAARRRTPSLRTRRP